AARDRARPSRLRGPFSRPSAAARRRVAGRGARRDRIVHGASCGRMESGERQVPGCRDAGSGFASVLRDAALGRRALRDPLEGPGRRERTALADRLRGSAVSSAPQPHSAEWLRRPERGSAPLVRFMVWLSLRCGRSLSRLLLYPTVAYFFLTAARARAGT